MVKIIYLNLLSGLILSYFSINCEAQNLIHDTINIRPTQSELPVLINDSIDSNRSMILGDTLQLSGDSTMKESWREFTNYFRLDFFTSLNAFYYTNPLDASVDKNSLYVYYNLNVTNQFTSKYLSVNTYLFNELGYRKYFDSISLKNEDSYSYKIDVATTVYKELHLNISYQGKSQLWNSWDYSIDTMSGLKRTLFSSYFSPGYIIYAAGFSYSFWNTCRFDIGFLGGQITKIINSNIYDGRNEMSLYGIEKGKRKYVELGLSAQLQVPAVKIGKCFFWENNSRLFIQQQDLKRIANYQLDFNNGFHFIFLKYLRLGLKTKISYDITISDKPFMSNMILFGFYLSNKI